MNRIIRTTVIILLVSMFSALAISAQNVTFYSSEFLEGVKTHLGLDEDSDVLQQQTDTITAINLSGLGIKDIRDVVYLPNVKTIDLSFNDIRNITPLLTLDSLRSVDLRSNLLEDISLLIFACSDSLVVNVAYNYITDFSRLFLPSDCKISIAGMSAQKDKATVFLEIYQLFADIDGGQPVVNYRGYSNMEDSVFLECGDTYVIAELDGIFNTVNIDGSLSSTTKAVLTNGVKGDSTFVVPPAFYVIEPSQTVAVETGLPNNYKIGFASALYGMVEVDGKTLNYTSPASGQTDTLYFSYYQGHTFKGFAEYYLGKDSIGPTKVKAVDTDDQQLKMSWQNGKLHVECPQSLSGGCSSATITVWDANGQLLATLQEETGLTGLSAEMIVPRNPGSVVIVQVDYCSRRLIGKLPIRP